MKPESTKARDPRPATRDRVAEWVRPEIRALHAYHVPPASGLIKLDAMENPYTWPPELVEQWLDVLRGVPLNRYPDPTAAALTRRLRTAMAVPEGTGLLLGNGSDELIQMVIMTVAAPGRCILAPEPSFVMYRMIATWLGMDCVGVPLKADFELDGAAMLEAIERDNPAVVFLAYPNNPTGNLFAAEDVRAILESAPGVVVVDEAYHAFAGNSFMAELPRYENLLVMRTLSKVGLAGLRLGVLAGADIWLREIDKTRLPYNIGVLTQASADFALQHQALLDGQAARIRHDRDALARELSELPGVRVHPSRANFLLFEVSPGRAEPIFEGLKEAGILIKKLHGAHPMLHECLRVTVGTADENAAFLEALRKAL